MSKKIVFSEKAPAAIGPYSQAVWAGDILFVSGQIAFEESQNGTVESETKQVMENIGHILKEAGLGYENIVKSSIFLKTMDSFGLVNTVYGSYFNAEPPARETVAVAGLPKNVNVEISIIAKK